MSAVAEAPPVATTTRAAPPPPARRVTLADWIEHLGVAPGRIIADPQPGSVDPAYHAMIDGRIGGRLVELIDGALVEKTMGKRESEVAMAVGSYLFQHIKAHKLGGKLCGADGMTRMANSNIRMSDVSWTAPEDVTDPERKEAAPREALTLAVEVISPGNTVAEMRIKLDEYFASGCRLAWLIYPDRRVAEVFMSPETRTEIPADGTLDGGDVLPGFSVKLADLLGE